MILLHIMQRHAVVDVYKRQQYSQICDFLAGKFLVKRKTGAIIKQVLRKEGRCMELLFFVMNQIDKMCIRDSHQPAQDADQFSGGRGDRGTDPFSDADSGPPGSIAADFNRRRQRSRTGPGLSLIHI